MTEIDWQQAASQVLHALRGRRSQVAFSRRLGYRSNVACDWEAGRRFPTAAEALRACSRSGVDVDAAFRAFQPACAAALRQGKQLRVDRWLAELAGATKVSQLAARSGFSRYALARWLQGRAQPRLPDFLELVEAISGRASDLVQQWVPIDKVDELRLVHERRAASKRIAFDAPWTEAVLRVLETTGYRSFERAPSGYVAKRLGFDLETERAALGLLEAAGVLRWERDHYREIAPLTVDTAGGSESGLQRLKMHWTRVCLERLATPRAEDWLGYNVVSTSSADLERIRDVLRRAFREVRAIAASSEPAESVALLNLQLVTWNDDGGVE